MEFKSKKCIFIGFTKGVKSFRLWDFEKKSVCTSRDVIINVPRKVKDRGYSAR